MGASETEAATATFQEERERMEGERESDESAPQLRMTNDAPAGN